MDAAARSAPAVSPRRVRRLDRQIAAAHLDVADALYDLAERHPLDAVTLQRIADAHTALAEAHAAVAAPAFALSDLGRAYLADVTGDPHATEQIQAQQVQAVDTLDANPWAAVLPPATATRRSA